eukprot:evm.model.scf_122.12 EVM.evm.TU.scf_122.12   scf_122:84604-85855(+)
MAASRKVLDRATRDDAWVDIREFHHLKKLKSILNEMQFHAGEITDMLSEEFREASKKLAGSEISAWLLRAPPKHPSKDALQLADHLLKPLNAALMSLDSRSHKVLLSVGFSTSVHALCKRVELAVGKSRGSASPHLADQLRLDVEALRGSCGGGFQGGERGAGRDAEWLLESEMGVVCRAQLIADFLSTPKSELKKGGWRRFVDLTDVRKWKKLARK